MSGWWFGPYAHPPAGPTIPVAEAAALVVDLEAVVRLLLQHMRRAGPEGDRAYWRAVAIAEKVLAGEGLGPLSADEAEALCPPWRPEEFR